MSYFLNIVQNFNFSTKNIKENLINFLNVYLMSDKDNFKSPSFKEKEINKSEINLDPHDNYDLLLSKLDEIQKNMNAIENQIIKNN